MLSTGMMTHTRWQYTAAGRLKNVMQFDGEMRVVIAAAGRMNKKTTGWGRTVASNPHHLRLTYDLRLRRLKSLKGT